MGRDGRLYAASRPGVWRTAEPLAVAAEAVPAGASPLDVSVRPNPAGGRVEVVLSLSEARDVRVAIVDALGREVAVVIDGPVGAGERVVGFETASWPAGVYVVRATAGRGGGTRVATARLVVVR